MISIEVDTLETYLRHTGRLAPGERAEITTLADGVSNAAFRVSLLDRPSADFVVKQAREQLRVPDPWFCGIDRIFREIEVLEICERLVTTRSSPARSSPACRSLDPVAKRPLRVAVPRLLFVDRPNHLFGMTAAGREAANWKRQLLAGEARLELAVTAGDLLATIHGQTWNDQELARRVGDRQYFDALRLDPYYRQVARVHPDLSSAIDGLIQSLAEHPRCLVHGDFSPKNLLVDGDRLTLIDFEVGHYGDPAFDLGFFLSHLVLKAAAAPVRMPGTPSAAYRELTRQFWRGYEERLRPAIGQAEYDALRARARQNLAGCLLARIDGKSRIDYLNDPDTRATIRHAAREWLAHGTPCDELLL